MKGIPEATIQCPRCSGAGKIFDDAKIGQALREKRLAKGIQLKKAAQAMHTSPQYLSDIEKGRRHWTHMRVLLYLASINALSDPVGD